MKNIKITVSLLTIATLFSANLAFAQTSNKDVDVDAENDNTRQQSVQEIINKELNAKLPGTNEATALAPNIASRETRTAKGRWGEEQTHSYMGYTGEIVGVENKNSISNCDIDAETGTCKAIGGVYRNKQDKFVAPADSNYENGFQIPEGGQVLTNQGEKGYEKFFYRYWQTENCPGGLTSCWSPSYPIICLPNLENVSGGVKNGELSGLENLPVEVAKNIFGVRTGVANDNTEYVKNGYYKAGDVKPSEVEYRMVVNVTPMTGAVGNASSGPMSVEVAKWSLGPTEGDISTQYCLMPDFNFAEMEVDGYKTTKVIGKPTRLDQSSGLSSESEPILPCGMYGNIQKDFIDSKGVKYLWVNDADAEYKCKNKETQAYVTKGEGPDSQYWTTYNITLPNAGSKESDTFSNNVKELRVRGCVKCEDAGQSRICQKMIKGVIEQMVAEGDKNPGCFVNDGEYSCNAKGLSALVYRLISQEHFELDNQSGYFDSKLTCNICKRTLESDLRSVLIH